MGEDSLDEVGGLDARDDAQCPTTKKTMLDIEMEDSFEPLHPVLQILAALDRDSYDT